MKSNGCHFYVKTKKHKQTKKKAPPKAQAKSTKAKATATKTPSKVKATKIIGKPKAVVKRRVRGKTAEALAPAYPATVRDPKWIRN